MKNLTWISIIVALVSLIVALIVGLGPGYLVGISPKSFIGFAGVSLLFGINFCLLESLKK